MHARYFAIAALAAASGCATQVAPIDFAPRPEAGPAEQASMNADGDMIMLALSGGGARASAFSQGVLQGLSEMPAAGGGDLLGRVRVISAVSGGSVTAAYYGQHGRAGLQSFRADFLDKDAEASLHTNPFSPANWFRLLDGGINAPGRLADWLDGEVYDHATMSALWDEDRPHVWINATDLFNGVSFAFTRPYFEAICSDLAEVRVADAVAASMAVPLAFRPVSVAAHADRCAKPLPAWVERVEEDRAASQLLRATARAFHAYRDGATMKFLHLVDGGVTDNLGLTALLTQRRASNSPLEPLSAGDAVRMRRLTVLVVNAEQVRKPDWALAATGPSGVPAASAALETAMDASKRAAYDSFRIMLSDWERQVRDYRCALTPAQVVRERGTLEGWRCADISFSLDMISFRDLPDEQRDRLGMLATRVSLPPADIDALLVGGKQVIQTNATALALTKPAGGAR